MSDVKDRLSPLDGRTGALLSCGVPIDLSKKNQTPGLDVVMIEARGAGARGAPCLVMVPLDVQGLVLQSGTVYHACPRAFDDAVRFLSDARPLGSTLTNDTIEVRLAMLPTPVDAVVVYLTHDGGRSRSNQSRIDVEVRVFDVAQGREIARVRPHTPSDTIVEIGRLMRSDGAWSFVEGGVSRHGFLADLISPTDDRGSVDAAPSLGVQRSDARHDPLDGIATETGAGYCDGSMRRAFVLRAAGTGISPDEAEIMVDLELERLRVANETVLLQRLDSVLHRFTQEDGRLDDKERRDALQIVCRAAPGYAQGLRHDVADGHVVRFCRERRVKIRVGLLRWQVP